MSGFAIAAGQEASVSSAQPPIERLDHQAAASGCAATIRRAFTGLRCSVRVVQQQTVYLVDMLGGLGVSKRGRGRCRTTRHRDISQSADLFYNGQIRTRATLASSLSRGARLEMDWKGRILWEVNHPITTTMASPEKWKRPFDLPKTASCDIASKVRGGPAGSE